MKASKALTVSVSVFRGWILWRFSLSKNNISPAAPDLELILFPLWYRPIMNAHTKQQQDKVFETDFIDSQKSDPPFGHLLALSHICFILTCYCYSVRSTLFFFLRVLIIWRLRHWLKGGKLQSAIFKNECAFAYYITVWRKQLGKKAGKKRLI